MSRSELKDLFSLHTDMPSHLHFKLMEEQRKLAEMEAEASDDDDDDENDNNKPGAAAATAARAFGEVEEKKGSGGKGKEKMAVVVEEKAPRPDGVSDVWKEQEGWPKETGDMHLWGHHLGTEKVRRVRCDATQMRAARVCVCLPSPHLLTHLRPLSLSLSLSLSL